MKKEGKIIVRIDKTLKEEAESILKNMGLSPGVAIDIFYRQIIFQGKMPFEIKNGGSKIHPPKDEDR
jgi:DNA-damage-inducible protein J